MPVIYWLLHRVRRWVRAKITRLENMSWKRAHRRERVIYFFFSLPPHLNNQMRKNPAICPSISPVRSSIHTFLSSISLFHIHTTHPLSCALVLLPSLFHIHIPLLCFPLTDRAQTSAHSHAQRDTLCPNRIILECDVWVITSESNRLSAFICSPGKQT